MDNIKKLKGIILELNEVTEAEHIKSITSSVTTSWGKKSGIMKRYLEIFYKTPGTELFRQKWI